MIFLFFSKSGFSSFRENPIFYKLEMSSYIFFANPSARSTDYGPPSKRGRFWNDDVALRQSSHNVTSFGASTDDESIPDLAPIYPNIRPQGPSLLEIYKRNVSGVPSFEELHSFDQFSTPTNEDLNATTSSEQPSISFDAVASFSGALTSLGASCHLIPLQLSIIPSQLSIIPSSPQTQNDAPIRHIPFKPKRYPGRDFTTVEIPYCPPPILFDNLAGQCHFCAHWGVSNHISLCPLQKPHDVSGNKITTLSDKTMYFIVLETPEGDACLKGDMYITLITGDPRKMETHFSNEDRTQNSRAFKTFKCLPFSPRVQDHVRVDDDDFFDIRLLKKVIRPLAYKPVTSTFQKSVFKAFASPIKMDLKMIHPESIPITIIVQIGDQYWTCRNHTIKQSKQGRGK